LIKNVKVNPAKYCSYSITNYATKTCYS